MNREHIIPPKVYLLVFAALVVGTLAMVAAARVELGPLNIVVAMTLAALQATLVALYFMRLRYSHRLNWIFAGASILWLLLLIGMVLTDVISRLSE